MPMLIEEEEAEIKEEEPTQDEIKKEESVLVDDEQIAQVVIGRLPPNPANSYTGGWNECCIGVK
ncbi:hypothetical protein ACTXT7_002040 [Hymenolepis weldensis]